MVMAGTESVSGPAADESLSSRLQWLRQRREALQEKLAQKNSELKNLCIEEAELTGVLPPEIPLEPGESPPNFRKRIATNLNYNQNLINKLKTSGTDESALKLELERQVQINIADHALAALNDPSENKTVRRKQRAIYQQSQRRLQEINAQLNFIRQSHGVPLRQTQSAHIPLHSSQPHLQTTAKHRTKKPRPPLDSSGKDLSPKVESRDLLQEGGISLSPLGPEHNFNYRTYDSQDVSEHGFPQANSSNTMVPNQNRATYHAPSPVDHRRNNPKFSEHDLNANSNAYVPPEHFRGRAYSQGGNSSSSISPQHFPEHMYRRVPNTYTEEERQMHYRQMKLKKQQSEELVMRNQQYSDLRYLDNEVHRRSAQIHYHETDFNVPRYDGQMHEYPINYNFVKGQQPHILRQRDSADNTLIGSEHKGGKPSVDTYIPPGYWMRLEDDVVWCSEDQMADRFGSLDRRKQNVTQLPNIETQSRYHTVAISGKNALPLQRPHQMQVQSPDSSIPSASNRILLRTQSLGSVEAWQPPGSSHDGSVDGRESTDGSYIDKSKEKEWYETSLDSTGVSAAPTTIQQQRAMKRASHHNPIIVPLPAKERIPVRSNSIPANRRLREQQQQQQLNHQQQLQQQQQQTISPSVPQQLEEPQQSTQRPPLAQSRFEGRVLEIPAESKPLSTSQENGNEAIISLNSPTNHTVVQPGKYQPYREVTKPFEMSDFYKYSTKYRKRVEANAANDQQQQKQQITQQPVINTNTQNDQNQSNNSMQRVHQPVQRNICPPYTLR